MPDDDDDDDDWLLTLRPMPDPVPATVRLRRALKTLLRAFKLRCVGMVTKPRKGEDDDQQASSQTRKELIP